jgi:hypothetical protein
MYKYASQAASIVPEVGGGSVQQLAIECGVCEKV